MANVTSIPDPGTLAGLLSDREYSIAQLVVSLAGIACSVLGLFSNLLNIHTFLVMGVEDSITASFLSLSITDFLLSIASLGLCVSNFFLTMERFTGQMYSSIDTFVFFVYFSICSVVMFAVNTLTTLFIAITRCMCVAKPLHFKLVFTKERSVFILAVIHALMVVAYVPLFAHTGVVERFNPQFNRTRFVIWSSPHRERIKDIVYFITATLIPFVSQVIIIVSIFIMSWSLISSAKFRQSSCAVSGQKTDLDLASKDNTNVMPNKSNNKLSGKDRQAVQQVILISAIFTLCTALNIPTSIAVLVSPEFDYDAKKHRYYRMYLLCYFMNRVISQLNSSVNLFVYLNYNTKFRQSCIVKLWQ